MAPRPVTTVTEGEPVTDFNAQSTVCLIYDPNKAPDWTPTNRSGLSRVGNAQRTAGYIVLVPTNDNPVPGTGSNYTYVEFRRGANLMPASQWQRMEKVAQIAAKVKRGELRILPGVGTSYGDLRDFAPEDQELVIDNTFEVATLDAWRVSSVLSNSVDQKLLNRRKVLTTQDQAMLAVN